MDKTPPQNGLILVLAVLSVATLVAIKPGFDAYYDGMFRTADVHVRRHPRALLLRIHRQRVFTDRGIGAIGAGALYAAGFTSSGVAAGSMAAGVQAMVSQSDNDRAQ